MKKKFKRELWILLVTRFAPIKLKLVSSNEFKLNFGNPMWKTLEES